MVSAYGNTNYTQIRESFVTRGGDWEHAKTGAQKQAGALKETHAAKAYGAQKTANNNAGKANDAKAAEKTGSNTVAFKEWKPLASGSSLIPTQKAGYGTVIGDVGLSDQAKDYYDKLKSKFHNMDFILVSKDMKGRVAANAAAYGNANKPVVLIDEEKLERMATDESFRKKYEGLIEMSQTKLQEMKSSLSGSGAILKNFGMSVDENGNTSFFATIEKSMEAQNKVIEKRRAAKHAEKVAHKKKADREESAERIEEQRERMREKKTYLEMRADSMEELMQKVAGFAYEYTGSDAITEEEAQLGQNIDFKG